LLSEVGGPPKKGLPKNGFTYSQTISPSLVTSTGTPLAGPAADRAREALDHYNQAMERLKSGDWAGFGTELDAMRGLLEDMSRQTGGH
jgi:hypothetical protein